MTTIAEKWKNDIIWREKQLKRLKDNPPNKGRMFGPHSKEHNETISIRLKGRSPWNKGKKLSIVHKNIINLIKNKEFVISW